MTMTISHHSASATNLTTNNNNSNGTSYEEFGNNLSTNKYQQHQNQHHYPPPPQWHDIDIKGLVKNISPKLWQWTHLSRLCLNDNNLIRLPPVVSNLVNLQYLDVSNNKIRTLPAEIGDMTCLRELYLNYNQLRVLPFELGKLFKLHQLGHFLIVLLFNASWITLKSSLIYEKDCDKQRELDILSGFGLNSNFFMVFRSQRKPANNWYNANLFRAEWHSKITHQSAWSIIK